MPQGGHRIFNAMLESIRGLPSPRHRHFILSDCTMLCFDPIYENKLIN